MCQGLAPGNSERRSPRTEAARLLLNDQGQPGIVCEWLHGHGLQVTYCSKAGLGLLEMRLLTFPWAKDGLALARLWAVRFRSTMLLQPQIQCKKATPEHPKKELRDFAPGVAFEKGGMAPEFLHLSPVVFGNLCAYSCSLTPQ